MSNIDKKIEAARKFKEYEMKITKMAGYLSDYYIDRAIETDDFSNISSFLIDYFSGSMGKMYDVGYLISKYKEFELNDRVDDVDFSVDEWYKIKYEIDNQDINFDKNSTNKMTEDEYIDYLVEKRKKEYDS